MTVSVCNASDLSRSRTTRTRKRPIFSHARSVVSDGSRPPRAAIRNRCAHGVPLPRGSRTILRGSPVTVPPCVEPGDGARSGRRSRVRQADRRERSAPRRDALEAGERIELAAHLPVGFFRLPHSRSVPPVHVLGFVVEEYAPDRLPRPLHLRRGVLGHRDGPHVA
jgi:hypothetical protein